MTLEEQTETELVALAQAGDVDAFAQLIERTRVIALALAFRLIANPETVRDVVQEATLQAFLIWTRSPADATSSGSAVAGLRRYHNHNHLYKSIRQILCFKGTCFRACCIHTLEI